MFSHNLSAPLSYVWDPFDLQFVLSRFLIDSHFLFRTEGCRKFCSNSRTKIGFSDVSDKVTLVTERWWRFQSIINISKFSLTHFVSKIRHQHRCSLKLSFAVFVRLPLSIEISGSNQNHSRSYIDVGSGCWRRNVLFSTLRCWWRFWSFWWPKSIICLY